MKATSPTGSSGASGPFVRPIRLDGQVEGRLGRCPTRRLLAPVATALIAPAIVAALAACTAEVVAPSTAIPLGPTWTSAPSPTPPPPTGTLPPTSTLTSAERVDALEPDIRIAEGLTLQCDYELAIPRWDEILLEIPEYAPGYLQRSWAYLGLVHGERYYETALENTIHALDDVDTAIAVGDQVTGDYYLARYDVYSQWVVLEELWSRREPLMRLAVDNLKMALALGNSDPLSPRSLVFELAALRECDEALAEASRLYDLVEPWDVPSAGINTALASAHLCRGDYSRALEYLGVAIGINDSPERRFDRAVALYGLGRLDEALEELDAQIDARPTFDGFRYYLRALVYYDLGRPDLAQEDLLTGSYNTWGRGGMASLVAGLLARDEGDRAGAIELLRLTEATIDRHLTPMLDRTRAELAALGEEPLVDSPESPALATPMATLPSETFPGSPPAQAVDYETGVRQFSLGCLDHRAFRFVSSIPLAVSETRSLSIRVEGRFSPSEADVSIFLWNPQERFWTMFPWEGDEIAVGNPGRFVSPSGDLVLAVDTTSGWYLTIDTVISTAEVVLQDGTTLTLGPSAE